MLRVEDLRPSETSVWAYVSRLRHPVPVRRAIGFAYTRSHPSALADAGGATDHTLPFHGVGGAVDT